MKTELEEKLRHEVWMDNMIILTESESLCEECHAPLYTVNNGDEMHPSITVHCINDCI